MNARRAGCGLSSGVTPIDAPPAAVPPAATAAAPVATLGDLPAFRAALEYTRADVEAYEQTEAYWRDVWSEP